MILAQNNNEVKSALDNSPEMEKGMTRDIIAYKIGIGSGRTYCD